MKNILKRRSEMKYNLLIKLSFLSCAILSFNANAQTAVEKITYLSEKDFFADMPTVLSATRLPQPQQDAPGAVTIIDRDMIMASGFNTVPDVLRMVPGMYVGYHKGHAPLAALHGLTNEFTGTMQVLIDGRSVYNSLTGSVEWNDIPILMEDIERIEVVRGPNAAAFGANAFMGVINIVTTSPAKLKSSSARLLLGDNGQKQLSAQYVGHTGAWDYRLSAGYRADDGFKDIYDSQKQKIAAINAEYRPTGRDVWQFGAGYNLSLRDRGDIKEVIDQPHSDHIHSSFVQARWQRVLSPDREFSVQLYHNAYNLESFVTTLPIAGLGNRTFTVGGMFDLQRTDLEAQYIFSPANDWRTVVGAGVRRDSALSPFYLGSNVRESNDMSRLFAHAEWRVNNQLNINLGAMLEDTSYTGREFSPRVALNYRLAPEHSLRASFSKASRTPTIFEEKGDYHFNLGPILIQQVKATGGLESQHINSKEIGYVGNFTQQGLKLDLRIYKDDLIHLISAERVPFPGALGGFTFTARNTGMATLRGYETSLRYRPNQPTEINVAYANTRVSSDDQDLVDSMPTNTFSLLASHKFSSQWQGSLGYYQASKVDPLGAGNPTPLAKRLDTRVAYRFGSIGPFIKRGETAFVLQNLLSDYQDFRNGNIAKTTGYFSLTAEW
jgi:iron complex outermembrane recepter protein